MFSIALGGLLLPALISAGPRQSSPGSKSAPVQELTTLKSVGSHDAPITIEVFSDYQCPQCRVFYLDTARQLMLTIIPAGDGNQVTRHFPLSIHSHKKTCLPVCMSASISAPYSGRKL